MAHARTHTLKLRHAHMHTHPPTRKHPPRGEKKEAGGAAREKNSQGRAAHRASALNTLSSTPRSHKACVCERESV
eukprot:1705178-Rhodomonas_salina.1